MSLQYNTTLGFYFPSFMVLGLNIKEKVDNLNNMTDRQKAIFTHEYVHFLQDITTTYGLRNCIHMVDIIKTYVENVRKNKSSTFEVPQVIPPDDPVGLNIDLKSYYVGETSDINVFHIDNIEIKNENLPNFKDIPLVTLIDNQTSKSVLFGTHAIIESQAYLMESEIYPGISAYDYPYNIVKKVVEFYYPDLAVSNENLIALCDAVLLSNFNCGTFMCETLIKMRDEQFSPNNSKDIYNYVINGKIHHNDNEYTVPEFFELMSSVTEKQLTDYFTSDHCLGTKEWIRDVVKFGRELRLNNISLFADIVSGTIDENREQFAGITRALGTPLLKWLDGRYSVAEGSEKENIQLFAAILNIYRLFWKGKTSCDMMEFCSEEKDNLVGKNCLHSPWANTDGSRLCPYTQMWKMWGLSGREPKKA